jgi:hypothetical protein
MQEAVCEKTRELQVNCEMDQLCKSLEILSDRVSTLGNRLVSVMRPDPPRPTVASNEPEEMLCDLAMCIKQRRLLVNVIIDHTNDYLDRLEI